MLTNNKNEEIKENFFIESKKSVDNKNNKKGDCRKIIRAVRILADGTKQIEYECKK